MYRQPSVTRVKHAHLPLSLPLTIIVEGFGSLIRTGMNPLQSVLVSMDVLLIGSERAETFSKRKVLRPLPLPKISGKGERKARRSFARGVANRDYVTQTWPARAPVIRFLSALWQDGDSAGEKRCLVIDI